MKTIIVPSSEVPEKAAHALNEAFEAQAGKEFLFLSSGGSSLKLLDYLDSAYFGQHSTISVLDERYSEDPALNNFAQIAQTNFYTEVKARGAQFIDTKILPDELMEEACDRFERELRAWVARTNGVIIASVGIGPDAHTGGMMPFPEDPEFFTATFNDDTHWTAAYDAGDKSPQRLRITCTIPFFRKIDTAILFVTGESKRDALGKLFSENGSLNESPCRIWREVSGAKLFTDQSL